MRTPFHVSAILTVLGVVLFARIPGDELWVVDTSNFAHGPAFALVAWLLAIMLRSRARRLSPWLEYLLPVAAALAIGAAIELLQSGIGRDATLGDLLRDALGALVAMGFLAFKDPRLDRDLTGRRWQSIGLLIGMVGSVALLAPLALTSLAYLERAHLFPILLDFNRPFGTYFVRPLADLTVERAALPATLTGETAASSALYIRTHGQKWWGLLLPDPVSDWRHYERLAIFIANPTDEPLKLQLRIHSGSNYGDASVPFVTILQVAPRSPAKVTIPLRDTDGVGHEAAIDTANVQALMLARSGRDRVTEFYVVRIWLE